jgi:hypothetical protein
MRQFMTSFVVVGLLAVGTMAPVSAHPLLVPPAGRSFDIQQADWDGCGPRCQEHRREVREREQAQHRRWEEHRGWDEGRQHPQTYGYQHGY